MSNARRPAIVVGASVARDNAWNETIALAERHEASVWVSPMSARNSFPEDHRLFAGFLAADRAKIVAALEPYDLILVLGASVFTYYVEGAGPFVPPGTTLIQLIDDPAMAAWSPLGMSIVTSLKGGIVELLDGAAPSWRSAPARASRPARIETGELSGSYAARRIGFGVRRVSSSSHRTFTECPGCYRKVAGTTDGRVGR